MGMNLFVAQVLWEMREEGLLEGHNSICELALHTLHSELDQARPKAPYMAFARERFGDGEETRAFEKTAFSEDGHENRAVSGKAFYRLFGLDDFASIDLQNKSATYTFDLNHPVEVGRTFDIVADYGTAEHIFNIGQFFKTTYDLLRPGGIALHLLPEQGQIYHGFYNLNSVLWRSLVNEGQYEVLRLVRFNAIPTDLRQFERTLKGPVGEDIRDNDARMSTLRFYLTDIRETLLGRQRPCTMILAALRKRGDEPFRYPQQSNKYQAPQTF